MKVKIGIYILLMLGETKEILAQKQTQTLQQVWTGLFNQTRINNKWGLWTDVHVRTKEHFFNHLSQFLIRSGVTYYINDNLRSSGGYVYSRYYPADNHSKITQPEHRLWQQVQWRTNYTQNKTVQGLRLEERYKRKIQNDSTLAEGYYFNYRLRYNFLWQIPLSNQMKKGRWSFVLNNEVFVNFGKEIIYNFFDQNRFFAGFSFNTNSKDNLQFGYMNVFQQLATGNKYRSVSVLRVFYFYNLDLRKQTINH